jgi:hypothetical protein
VRQVFVFFIIVGSGLQKKEILRIAQVRLFSIFKNHLDLWVLRNFNRKDIRWAWGFGDYDNWVYFMVIWPKNLHI